MEAEALQKIRDDLWEEARRSGRIPSIRIPNWEDPPETVPQVQAYRYGMCPVMQTELYRYGTPVLQEDRNSLLVASPKATRERNPWVFYKIAVEWHTDRDTAQQRNDALRAAFITFRKCEKYEQDQKEAEDLYYEAAAAASDLQNSRLGYHFMAQVDQRLVQDLQESYWGDKPRETEDIDLETAYGKIEVLEFATRRLREALEKAHTTRLQMVRENGLAKRLGSLLAKHLPSCILCGQPYKVTDSLEDLAVYGEAYLNTWCACPEKGWQYERSDDAKPEIVRTLENYGMEISRQAQYIQTRQIGTNHRAIELRQVRQGDHIVIRFVAAANRPGLIVETHTLAATDANKPYTCVNTWEHARQTIEDGIYARTEAEARIDLDEEIREGLVVKLRFAWNERYNSWSAADRHNGVTTVFRVDDRYAEKIKHGGAHFCRITLVPDKARTPTFVLAIVEPFLKVREQPAAKPPSTPPKPPARPPASGSKGMGTFGDLLRDKLPNLE